MTERPEEAASGVTASGGAENAATADSAMAGAPPVKPKTLLWAPVTSLAMTFLHTPALMCTCGYLGWEGLLFTAGSATIAWYGWVASKGNILVRLLHMTSVILATLVLAKNSADVLWLGHDPVW